MRSIRFHVLAPFVAALLLTGCATAPPPPPFEPPIEPIPTVADPSPGDESAGSDTSDSSGTPDAPAEGWTQTGVASWYGEPFHGRRTASGEVYDMDELTAAHQTLPFGTVVDVLNLDNGRSIELRITDRGPFAKNRILDVSRAGARALDMIGPGTANVRITILREGGDSVARRGGCVIVQIAAFRDRDDAEARASEAAALGFRSSIEVAEGWYRVSVGPFHDADQVDDAVEELGGFPRRCVAAEPRIGRDL